MDGLRESVSLARPWAPGSTVLLIVSDGDTVPDTGMPEMPRSIAQSIVIGVGDSRSGRFIDGHQSRQDAATLRQVAGRLRGTYQAANVRHLPSVQRDRLARVLPMKDADARGRREMGLAAIALGSLLLAAGPLALALFGSNWQPATCVIKPGRDPDPVTAVPIA